MRWPNPETWPGELVWPEPYRRWVFRHNLHSKPDKDIEALLLSERNQIYYWENRQDISLKQAEVLAVCKANVEMLMSEMSWRRQGEDGPFR